MANPERPAGEVQSKSPVRYTIATLVNSRVHHEEMVASFRAKGFAAPDCEYLFIDNTTGNGTDAYRGLNKLLADARGEFIILCHQDVRLVDDDRARLDLCLAQLEVLDPTWAVAGNAGGIAPGRLALRITDPHGDNRRVGELPARVMSLDENFLVVRRDARLSFSRNLSGFHFYGADLCLVADVLGWSCYVIDFHLVHLSAGAKSSAFEEAERDFRAKWTTALRPRWMQTTCSLVHVGGGRPTSALTTVAARPFSALLRRLPGTRGWSGPPASAHS